MVSLLPSLPLPWPFASRPNSPPTDPPPSLDHTAVPRPANGEASSLKGKAKEAAEGAEEVAKYLALLEPFTKEAGGALPSGARTDPDIAQAGEGGLSWKLWEALPFFTGQGEQKLQTPFHSYCTKR